MSGAGFYYITGAWGSFTYFLKACTVLVHMGGLAMVLTFPPFSFPSVVVSSLQRAYVCGGLIPASLRKT